MRWLSRVPSRCYYRFWPPSNPLQPSGKYWRLRPATAMAISKNKLPGWAIKSTIPVWLAWLNRCSCWGHRARGSPGWTSNDHWELCSQRLAMICRLMRLCRSRMLINYSIHCKASPGRLIALMTAVGSRCPAESVWLLLKKTAGQFCRWRAAMPA